MIPAVPAGIRQIRRHGQPCPQVQVIRRQRSLQHLSNLCVFLLLRLISSGGFSLSSIEAPDEEDLYVRAGSLHQRTRGFVLRRVILAITARKRS